MIIFAMLDHIVLFDQLRLSANKKQTKSVAWSLFNFHSDQETFVTNAIPRWFPFFYELEIESTFRDWPYSVLLPTSSWPTHAQWLEQTNRTAVADLLGHV